MSWNIELRANTKDEINFLTTQPDSVQYPSESTLPEGDKYLMGACNILIKKMNTDFLVFYNSFSGVRH